MPWTRLKFAPGITKDTTRYASSGTWFDASLVRFRNGFPEMWSGWQRIFNTLTMNGMCRSLHRFTDLSGFEWLGVGTSHRFYVVSDDVVYDVTPVDLIASLGNNPFSVTNGSNVITVTHVNHNHLPGDAVIFAGSSAVGGILAADINKEFSIATYIDPDHYTVNAATNATSTTTGGGAGVTATYLFAAGSDNQITGGGWGADGWGEEVWGGDPSTGSQNKIGIWTQDNWGEDLVANANKGPIFYWDATSPSARMIDILDLVGADGNAPAYSEFILVSHKDRHLLAFGATEFGGSGAVAPMSFRWCDQENILNWDEADLTGTAGSLPLSRGSRFLAAVATQQEIVAWTDQAMYSIQYLGGTLIYGAELITDFSDIISMKAAIVYDSSVFWMGRSGFYSYVGRVEKMPCTVWDYVSHRIDFEQSMKVHCSTNRSNDEIIWFYPSVDGGGEIDSYVTFDMVQGIWNIGMLNRTAWLDLDTLNYPIAASTDSFMYQHEYGSDDGSQTPSVPLAAYIESGPIELSSEGSFDKGDKFMFIRRILPDITFRGYTDNINTPKVNLVLKMTDKPGDNFDQTSSSQVARSVILPVEQFTDELQVRLRGRSMSLRIDSPQLGTKWRLGVPRIDVRTDGQR